MRKWILYEKTNQQVILVSSFLISSTNSEADGSATLKGLFEPFVEAVISGLRLGYYPRKELLANYDLVVLQRKRAIAVTETAHLTPPLSQGEGGKTI